MTIRDQEATTEPNGKNRENGLNGVQEEGFEIGHANGDVEATLASLKTDKDGEKKNLNNGIGNGSHHSVRENAGTKKNGKVKQAFLVLPDDLSFFAKNRDKNSLIRLLEKGVDGRVHILKNGESSSSRSDIEMPSIDQQLFAQATEVVAKLKDDQTKGPYEKYSPEQHQMDMHVDSAVSLTATLLLRSCPEKGISSEEVEYRREVFGTNAITEKPMESFLALCWDAVQDFVLIMLIVLGVITLVVEITGKKGDCGACWAEGTAILLTVLLVVILTAGIDYAKQFAFQRLSRTLFESNTKQVIRNGKQVTVIDDDIVVGDILCVNSHALATIPADCVLLGPSADLKMDESTLTGESEPVSKKPGDVVLSGTNAVQGSGKMLVIAVGVNSEAGKIRARVYDSEDQDGELGDGGENSPLFTKLDKIAQQIGIGGTVAAVFCFVIQAIIGLGFEKDPYSNLLGYVVTSITVLAVAVPEGLPLAVTLSLAFSSNKMTKDNNLVRKLNACETMGCATTICTDKTGTLTANKMTARALYAAEKNMIVDDPKKSLGEYVKEHLPEEGMATIGEIISINTMNETALEFNEDGTVKGSAGNPTEVALLVFVHGLGLDYQKIRNTTRGRASVGELAEYLADGKLYGFSSARKMMSWAVPLEDGRYRIYTKGAPEVVLSRCSKCLGMGSTIEDLTPEGVEGFMKHSQLYARRGMRTLALAYGDLPVGTNLEEISSTIKNADGSPAFQVETNLVAVGLVGIEDPLRHEVQGAITKCYGAGIDVRMVTGDNPNTAASISYQAGILRDFHFKEGTTERVASNLKENVLMTGDIFREKVYRVKTNEDGDIVKQEFDQSAFDKIWPFLRVLARSSPDDKLTLAHGLNQSTLFADDIVCKKLKTEHNITIFPDRQVIAMTGDGTNDATALKRADIGFAMGVSGTQIAKDAADIILLDDNFASIVTAAKWGRNIYASLQKFLQFQLTVNISAVTTAIVGACAYQYSPLAAIQLLWVNLIMDALASLALASEPPVEELLNRPPVNRTDSMISTRMWANMLGQAGYQVCAVMTLLFAGPELLNLKPGHEEEDEGVISVHYTLIFNTFVWMQLFNEINSRKLKGECNVFKGMFQNPIFCSILLVTSVLQVLIVQFGGKALHVAKGGLSVDMWALSLILGAFSLPLQQLINMFFTLGLNAKSWRQRLRLQRDASLRSWYQSNTAGHLHQE